MRYCSTAVRPDKREQDRPPWRGRSRKQLAVESSRTVVNLDGTSRTKIFGLGLSLEKPGLGLGLDVVRKPIAGKGYVNMMMVRYALLLSENSGLGLILETERLDALLRPEV